MYLVYNTTIIFIPIPSFIVFTISISLSNSIIDFCPFFRNFLSHATLIYPIINYFSQIPFKKGEIIGRAGKAHIKIFVLTKWIRSGLNASLIDE